MDFYNIIVKQVKSNNRESDFVVYPDFVYSGVKDLVCKGGDMYAFWTGKYWSTEKDDLINTIDNSVRNKVKELQDIHPEKIVSGMMMNNNSSGLMKTFDNYTKLMSQSDVIFNQRIMFANEVMERDDYATNQLSYSPEEGCPEAFYELLNLLYRERELNKIRWFIGALLTNNMRSIQKFLFLYGGKGSGKGTVIEIFKKLFAGYSSPISLRSLTSDSEFSTSQIKEVPLLIDEDSNLSRVKDDTNLLKLTAHEPLIINKKHKSTYETVFNGLLITASNQRYQVRNVDSGITRRAIVAEPTSDLHNPEDYFRLIRQIDFELPQIANDCIEWFNECGPYYYEDYVDVAMAEATDYIFSFVRENATQLGDVVTLKRVAELYKLYLEDLGYDTKGYKRKIKTEMQRYYKQYHDRYEINGERVKNVFTGFKRELVFPDEKYVETPERAPESLIELGVYPDIFMDYAGDFPAQYANQDGTPKVKWDDCKTTLSELDQTKLHYVRVPLNHIVIDFDLKNSEGDKDLYLNLEAASMFPPTYSEVSKSGKGIHLHYTYDGDVTKLANLYDEDIEIKVFTGKSSLRRQYTESNNLKVAHISTGLPYKERDGVKVYNNLEEIVWNEKKLRTSIIGNLNKKYHSATKPSIDFIAHILKEAESSGTKYDVRDMKQAVVTFAMNSSNNAEYCLEVVNKMNFTTIDNEVDTMDIQKKSGVIPKDELVFYDIEVFPNLFVVCARTRDNKYREGWINPSAEVIENLLRRPLVGFNNRRYDNHIMYGAMLGKSIPELYQQSVGIVNNSNPNAFYSGAYELSYADIYEYSSKKQGLKKWEIDLGILHDEMEMPWDQPVPEDKWDRVLEYCFNDIDATVAVFDATEQDYVARVILSELSGLSINATTTQHAAAFLFGDDPRPQDKFNYVDLGETFPGYTFSFGKSEYKGEDPSEGGYVYAEPGVYENVTLADVESMHPTSLVVMNYFGPYTQRYADLLQTRLHIKHGDFEAARKMFDGALKPYLKDETSAKALSYALKIIINIVYGMTSAKFENKFKHPKNKDNIIAKRGALFMIDLKLALQERGKKVVHVKTDSVKIVDMTEEDGEFIIDFGKKYGYNFEFEDVYDKFALVNKAVYICQNQEGKWDATGAQFAEPYVFKSLFTGEELLDTDFFLTKQVRKGEIYLGDKYIGRIANIYADKNGEEITVFRNDKHNAVPGTKGYKWKLASDLQSVKDIDIDYYHQMASVAVETIDKVGPANKIVREGAYDRYCLPF